MSDRAVTKDGEGTAMADEQHTEGDGSTSGPDEVTGVTQVAPGTSEETTAVMPPVRRPSRLRRLLIGLLVLLSLLAVVITGVTWWAHYTVMNTDGYMKIVGPLGKDPQVIQNLSEYLSSQIVQTTDLQQRIGDALPSQVQILSGPITAYVEQFITKGADKVLSSPKGYQLWLEINRIGHTKIVALLRGETTDVYVQGSDVKLNLLPLISQALVWLDERLPGGLSNRFNPPVIAPDASPEQGIQEVADWSGRPLPSDFGQITLLQSDALGPAQTAVKWFDRLIWILPLVTAALIALTIWLSRRRGRTAIAIGIGAAIAIFITRVIVTRASAYLTSQLEEGRGRHLVQEVVDASLRPLTTLTVWICVIGVVAAVLVWALGRRDVRAGVVAAGRRVAGQTAELQVPDSPVTSWIAYHVVPVRWGVLVIGLIVLALVASSWLGIIVTIVVELLLQGVLSLLAGQWPFAETTDDKAVED
jgi:hypothetical protein